MFKFEARFYSTITRNKANKSLQKNFPLKSGFSVLHVLSAIHLFESRRHFSS